MTRETFNYPHAGERAIKWDELRLKTGEFPNKMVLQRIGFEAGLPVAPILTESRSIELLSAGLSKTQKIFLRGFYPSPVDMWAVDMLPTFRILSVAALRDYQERFTEEASDPRLPQFISRNFSVNVVPGPEYFLQLGDPGLVYFSSLTYGPYTFLNANNVSMGRGVNWCTLFDGSYTRKDHWHYDNQFVDEVLSISRQADEVFDNAFVHQQTRFGYKHDFIYSTTDKRFTLVQSRVVSRRISNSEIIEDEEWICTQIASGLLVGDIEPYEIADVSSNNAPGEPYILRSTNDSHKGAAKRSAYLSMDLSRMVGLILPEDLRGGLLEHMGFGIWSVALYRGLPISFTA